MLNNKQININRAKIRRLLISTKREGVRELLKYLDDNGFYEAPASTKYHQNYRGGLAEHSLNVFYYLSDEVTLSKLNIKKSSVIITALLHDLCKIDMYNMVNYNDEDLIIFNKDCEDKRHADKSIDIINNFIDINEEETYMVKYHMGIYRKEYTWNDFGEAIKLFKSVYLIHVADMKDTYDFGRN